MRQKPSLALSLGLALLGTTAALVAVACTLYLSSSVERKLVRLQEESSLARVGSVLQAFDQNLRSLADYAGAYAMWDDTYSYVQNRDQSYIDRVYDPAILAVGPVQLVAIYDRRGNLLTTQSLNDEGTATTPPRGLDDADFVKTFLPLRNVGEYEGRMAWLDGRAYLIALCPITNSKGSVPANGYLLFGTSIGPRMLANIDALTRVQVQAMRAVGRIDGESVVTPNLGLASVTISPPNAEGNSEVMADFRKESPDGVLLKMKMPMLVWRMGQQLSEVIRHAFLLVSAGFAVFAIFCGVELSRRHRDIRDRIREGEELRRALESAEDLQEKAEAADRAKSAFLAMMSHEIRTPLNAIIGYADLLKGSATEPEVNQGLQSIRDSGVVLLRVLNDVLDFSKNEAGKLTLHPAPFDPRKVVDEVLTLFRTAAEEKSNRLSATVADDVPATVVGDAARIKQVLYNLIGNSVKFTINGEIRLTVLKMPRELIKQSPIDHLVSDVFTLTFRVEDEGVGVAPGGEKQLFEPFSQIDSASTRRYDGAGMGLAICRRLCQLMGGDIFYNRPSVGSSFEAVIPSGTTNRPGRRFSVDQTLVPIKPGEFPLSVLVVDDNSTNARLLSSVLRRIGIEPRVAASGQEAIDFYQQTPADLILMDIQMPEMDGLEASRRIRSLEEHHHWQRSRIVAVTADVLTTDREKSTAFGMDDYLSKPIRLDQIESQIRQCEIARGAQTDRS